jgi:hypothetical protein
VDSNKIGQLQVLVGRELALLDAAFRFGHWTTTCPSIFRAK